MILDRLDELDKYAALHPAFPEAIARVRSTDWSALSPGRHEWREDRLFALLADGPGKERAACQLEVHRRYIDLQFVLRGTDVFGWRSLADCTLPTAPFDAEKDIVFFADAPVDWIALPVGHFVIFLPGDAHAPLATTESVRKVIVKIER